MNSPAKMLAWTAHEVRDWGLGVIYTGWVVLLVVYLAMTLA